MIRQGTKEGRQWQVDSHSLPDADFCKAFIFTFQYFHFLCLLVLTDAACCCLNTYILFIHNALRIVWLSAPVCDVPMAVAY